ncbi:serine/threonine-protein kinase [Streptomyces sp. I4(2020)]|uniref:serine/threonine protein kinase n=1 Tax=Streptomyces sp. I4(2020) TaxID=2760981 RepID=UPI0018EE848A|nr:serine/threonine-protein kinase [Streptomyces sp. I4(2020)]MBJ6629546.1 serine/threonine protein kinase [Streptomyces sp. I4(2020)]
MGWAHASTDRPVAGRYRLVEITHRETNRVSWYADDLRTGRPCLATRVELPADAVEGVRRAPSRILRATENVARLCPDRIADVVDAVGEGGCLWTVTAWIDGTPLDEVLLQHGTFAPARAARVALDLLDVLDAAHPEAVTHGELSPGQLYLRETGPVIVTGYGVAGTTSAPRLTAPSYAAPEQARNEQVGPAADLWALGAILYTMLEGRPPFRDRGRVAATLRGVDRLPLRPPVRCGPLTGVVTGLLRKEPRERPDRQVVRDVLTRVLREAPGGDAEPGEAYAPAGRGRKRKGVLVGTPLAVLTVTAAVVAAATGLPDGGDDRAGGGPAASASSPAGGTGAADTAPRVPPSAGAAPPSSTAPSSPPSPSPSGSASPSPSDPGSLPAGFRVHRAPEGFSVALPAGWERQRASRAAQQSYRVTFGADDDPRTLAVTYSERVGPDPVAVWRDTVEPGLARADAYQRIGAIEATTYQGREAADMQWITTDDGVRVRTFGRGFLLGDGRGFSLRWSTPAAEWTNADNQETLRTVLRTFRPGTAG